MTVDKILKDREATHGSYHNKAELIQMIKAIMRESDEWWELDYDMQESLDMIVTKIGRIIYGNASEPDHWNDIEGYAKLISNRLNNPPKSNPKLKK